jgi:hypothetical protein
VSQLGGGEDFFVGTAVEGEPLPAFAPEDGVPGAPVLFGAQEDSLFSAPFTQGLSARKSVSLILLSALSRASSTVFELSGYSRNNFAHQWGGHKMNDVLPHSTYARRQVTQPLHMNLDSTFNLAQVLLAGLGYGP